MAENDAPNQLEDEDEVPLVVPSHIPLPPPPEVHYTRPTLGKKSSSATGRPASQNSVGKPSDLESQSAAGHGAGLGAGLTFVTSIIAGLLAGNWLDGHYIHSSTPWGTMGMTIVGAAVGFTNMSRLLSRGDRRKP